MGPHSCPRLFILSFSWTRGHVCGYTPRHGKTRCSDQGPMQLSGKGSRHETGREGQDDAQRLRAREIGGFAMSVYALGDPRTRAIRYVGSARWPRDRLVQHMRSPHSQALRAWFSDLKAMGLEPDLRVTNFRSERRAVRALKPDLNVLLTGKPGHRRLPLDKRRRQFVGFLSNDREFEAVQESAAGEGRTVADWLRRIAVNTVRP